VSTSSRWTEWIPFFRLIITKKYISGCCCCPKIVSDYSTRGGGWSVTAGSYAHAKRQCIQLSAKTIHTFPCNFSVDGEASNWLRTCYHRLVADLLLATRPTSPQQIVVMEFGKRHDTTDTTNFCLLQLVTGLLRGNWRNGLWLYWT